ncbi:MAG TPA: transglutaminase domain-containing protein [Ktedonobacteraceae bacterium]|nr:transglutaminase domain-containing protein [Ktedonobacteraceae bacterium]
MDLLEYYTEQSAMTDPGAYAGLYEDLPCDIAGLCKVVQGLIIHYRDADLFDHVIPDERLPEINTRSVEKMLARIQELDARPLTAARSPDKCLVGCCRDFATLFCSMARHQGIPTRVRVGFATYFVPYFNCDHEIAECWDAGQHRWRLIDPELSQRHLQTNRMIIFDPLNVPRERFLVAGLAWQRCRRGKADPDNFGVDPAEDLKGLWFIRQKLVQDLAALNKQELLLWDCWGLMEKQEISDEDEALLDRVATLTQADDKAFAEIQVLYEHGPGLRVTPPIMSYSPVAEPYEVAI